LSTETHTHNDSHHPRHHHDNEHAHDHGIEHDHVHQTGIRGWLEGLLRPHSHDHSDLVADQAFADNQAGIRTVWLALAALTITSILQLAIVFASGSVALLADTAHNIGDGLNSIPLLIAFYLARKAVTRRYTYGFGRAEDIAGIFIVLSILVSAGIVFWESFQRLLNPQPLENIGWVAAAAIIGFLGNEFVAVMQIRVGKRIGSAALVADGLHARTDGLTSLAVLVAASGAWLGFPLVDPIIGLLIGVAILFITWDATKRMWYRLMDAVEPEILEKVETAVSQNANVRSIQRLRLRWVGHQLYGDIQLSLQTTADPAEIKHDIRHTLHHQIPKLTDITIEIDTIPPKHQP
jgi:cation diffusion facilitator family transporter